MNRCRILVPPVLTMIDSNTLPPMSVPPLTLGPVEAPSEATLRSRFLAKHGPTEADLGWGTAMKWRHGVFNPDDWYEALVGNLVVKGTRWLDVGCGRNLFPSNQGLARELSQRSGDVVGVDPDKTLEENPYVHEKVHLQMDEYTPERPFDLLTLRMVAEHVADPKAIAERIGGALKPGGVAVIYTVSKYSPIPMLTALTPMWARHKLKKWLWNTEEKDTFPTCFLMNTRGALKTLFQGVGCEEAMYLSVDDCRTLAKWKLGLGFELRTRNLLRAVGLGYPERCIIGVYRKS